MSWKLLFVVAITVTFCFARLLSANEDLDQPGFKQSAEAFQNGNYIQATRGFAELAEKNNATAQYNYAALLFKGLGTTSDIEEAWFWAWRAKLNGIEKAGEIISDISKQLGADNEERLIKRLVETIEPNALDGAPAALSSLARIYYEVPSEPSIEDSYVWSLVAQAYGQTDVQDIITYADKIMPIDSKISKQSEARKIFQEMVKSN